MQPAFQDSNFKKNLELREERRCQCASCLSEAFRKPPSEQLLNSSDFEAVKSDSNVKEKLREHLKYQVAHSWNSCFLANLQTSPGIKAPKVSSSPVSHLLLCQKTIKY